MDRVTALDAPAAAGELSVRLLHADARPPARTRPHDAGYDLSSVEALTLAPGERRLVGTGVAVAIPPGIAGLVTPRSGLAINQGIHPLNSPGLVDPNYRGELRVALHNAGAEPVDISVGDRIAQLLLVPFWAPSLIVVEDLPASPDDRGEAGFGSSGR
ncbi:MAG: dUTP diphosphatase, partial [Conexibacter sp.]|nr:dUTP diphosphatase [Conexibacter sp.]